MYERTHKRSLLQRMAWFAALMVAAVSIAFAMIYSIPTAHAGDCWGRALSEDHLHCYILEEAQKAGVIDVEAVFEAGRTLHIYLDQTDPVSDEVGQFFREKAAEFIDRWPDHVYYGRSGYSTCRSITGESKENCLLNDTLWRGDSLLPYSKSYTNIVLRTGGADARMDETGWPSYRQVWPDLSPADRTQRSANGFDVSEVDTTNLPPVNCYNESGFSCRMALEFPDLHIAGYYTYGKYQYVQVKIPPSGEVDREAVIDELSSRYSSDDRKRYTIIPVKYSYEELWRWKEIIKRFSHSSGNTLGITWVGIGQNYESSDGEMVFPLAHLQPLPRYEHELPNNGKHLYRETIRVRTLNLQETVDALPQLLGQLGIPVDAVGVVIEDINETPRQSYPLPSMPLSGE